MGQYSLCVISVVSIVFLPNVNQAKLKQQQEDDKEEEIVSLVLNSKTNQGRKGKEKRRKELHVFEEIFILNPIHFAFLGSPQWFMHLREQLYKMCP